MSLTKLNNRYFNINFETSKENTLGNMNGGGKLHSLLNNNSEATILKNLDSKYMNEVNKQDNNGNTPLHLAVQNNMKDVALKLIDMGAQFNIMNKKGECVEPTEEYFKFLENKNIVPKPNLPNLPEATIGGTSISELSIEDISHNHNSVTSSYVPTNRTVSETSYTNNTILGGSTNQDSINSLTIESDNNQHAIQLNSVNNTDLQASYSFDSITVENMSIVPVQQGGAKKNVVIGSRTIVEDIDVDLVGGVKRRKKSSKKSSKKGSKKYMSREEIKEADQLHQDTIKKIMKDMKVDELEARVLKAILYKHIRETMPELSNLDRAKELLKNATKKMFKELDKKVKELGPEIRKHLEEKKAKLTTTSENTESTD